MKVNAEVTCRQLTSDESSSLKDLLGVFAEAFDDETCYRSAVPSDAYLRDLLTKPHFIALVAEKAGELTGGLTAYVLDKFEQDRREIYIYDLAVLDRFRRIGVATALINALRRVAASRNAYVIFVQADLTDAPAIALYESLGTREDVLHFDIAVQVTHGR